MRLRHRFHHPSQASMRPSLPEIMGMGAWTPAVRVWQELFACDGCQFQIAHSHNLTPHSILVVLAGPVPLTFGPPTSPFPSHCLPLYIHSSIIMNITHPAPRPTLTRVKISFHPSHAHFVISPSPFCSMFHRGRGLRAQPQQRVK